MSSPRQLLGVLIAGCAAAHAASPQFEVSDPQYRIVPIVRASAQHRGPHLRDASGSSTNWAGYAAESSLSTPTLGAVTAVSGTWTVPKIAPGATGTAEYSAAWVGIDGFEDAQLQALFSKYPAAERSELILATQTVEQIGTEHDWTGQGTDYYAWFEFYPNYAYEIEGFPVAPAETITGSVTYLGNNRWQCVLTNTTRRVSVAVTATFAADRYSAEWIVEAPSLGTEILPLADFGQLLFSGCAATINGKTEPLRGTASESLNMVTTAGTAVRAATSSLNPAGNGFVVKWLAN